MPFKTDSPAAGDSFSGQAITASTFDPAEFELALRPWELHCRPQNAGDFRHHVTAIRSPGFVLYRESYELQIKLQGLTPDRMLAICVPLDLNLGPVVWGNEYSENSIPVALPGPVDASLHSGYRQLIALVAIDHLRQAIPEGDYERLESAARSRVLQLPPQLIHAFSRWGNGYLNIAEAYPARFASPVLIQQVFLELTDFLLQISAILPPPRPLSNLATRKRGLLRAIEYLRNRLDTRIAVTQLCRVAGISERSLQYAFREEFGISPTEFMKQRRLFAARRKLTAASARNTSVSQIALECGFSELGRFAVDYRRLFDVHPSDTLKSRRAAPRQSEGKPTVQQVVD